MLVLLPNGKLMPTGSNSRRMPWESFMWRSQRLGLCWSLPTGFLLVLVSIFGQNVFYLFNDTQIQGTQNLGVCSTDSERGSRRLQLCKYGERKTDFPVPWDKLNQDCSLMSLSHYCIKSKLSSSDFSGWVVERKIFGCQTRHLTDLRHRIENLHLWKLFNMRKEAMRSAHLRSNVKVPLLKTGGYLRSQTLRYCSCNIINMFVLFVGRMVFIIWCYIFVLFISWKILEALTTSHSSLKNQAPVWHAGCCDQVEPAAFNVKNLLGHPDTQAALSCHEPLQADVDEKILLHGNMASMGAVEAFVSRIM